MRVIEARAVVLLNPEDAADHPDGLFGGVPIVTDPQVPPGWARFRQEIPPELAAQASEPWQIDPSEWGTA